jgi:cytochrome c-type biogenesis protein CcmH/NrfG
MDQVSEAGLSAGLQRVAALLETDPAAAEREALGILQQSPNDPRAALMLASAMRRTGDFANALTVLNALAAAFPQAALTQYELGLVLDAAGDRVGAVAALRRAAQLAPDHAHTWRALGDLLFRLGETGEAEKAFAEVARCSVGNPRLTGAASSTRRRCCGRTLRRRPMTWKRWACWGTL